MSSTSRVLRDHELTAVTAVWWRDTSPKPKPEAAPRREAPKPPPPAPPAIDREAADREKNDRERNDREKIEREAYQRGFAEGSAVGKDQGTAEVKPTLERVSRCLAELSSMRGRMRRQAEKDLVKLSIAVARRVLHRELTLDPSSIAGLIRVALEKLESRELCRVRVHPDQEGLVRELVERFSGSKVEIVPDATLNRGDVLLDTANGTIDASVDSQLKEIERGLADRLES
jgi:flagellar assembly protein FliH